MGKSKPKRKANATTDFTDDKRTNENYTPIQVTERGQVVGKTMRRHCPALRWTWLNEHQQAALVRYWDLAQECDVTVNGCLTPKLGGTGSPVGAERRMMKRSELEAIRKACTAPALRFTDLALLGDAPMQLDNLAHMHFGQPRLSARYMAKEMIQITAAEMVRFFGA
jgi:hypothetical protein